MSGSFIPSVYILCYNCIHFPDIFGVTIIYILKLGVTRVPTYYIVINLIKKVTVVLHTADRLHATDKLVRARDGEQGQTFFDNS